MRNLIFGGIGVVLGLALLVGSLTTSGTVQGNGAYRAGESAGVMARIPIAIILLVAGLWAVRNGIRARRAR